MTGKKVKPIVIRKPVAVAADTLRSYAGRYEMKPGVVFDVRVDGGVLTARLTGQPAFPLFAHSSNRFFYRAVKAEIEFAVKDGMVTGLTLFQSGREIPAARIE